MESMNLNMNLIKSEYPSEISSYKPIRIIGRGSFGSLYEGIVLSGKHKDEHVAIKQLSIDKIDDKRYKYYKVRISNKNNNLE